MLGRGIGFGFGLEFGLELELGLGLRLGLVLESRLWLGLGVTPTLALNRPHIILIFSWFVWRRYTQ